MVDVVVPQTARDRYRIVPLSRSDARQFVERHHRHNEAPPAWQVIFVVGLESNDGLIGVAIAGRPVARSLADGTTLEVTRVCIDGDHRNDNSALYGAVARAAKALGYVRLITYTLVSESGTSLRASGFRQAATVAARSWAKSSVAQPRFDMTLWGERKNAANLEKIRWEKNL